MTLLFGAKTPRDPGCVAARRYTRGENPFTARNHNPMRLSFAFMLAFGLIVFGDTGRAAPKQAVEQSAAGKNLKRKSGGPSPSAPPKPRSSHNAPKLELKEDGSARSNLTNLPPPDTSAPPPMLPQATREKMRGCANEWSRLKMETRGPLPMWRDFAGKCLTR
jgi:hypothetical protein